MRIAVFDTHRHVLGFGCRVVAHDLCIRPDLTELGIGYVPLEALYEAADIVRSTCP